MGSKKSFLNIVRPINLAIIFVTVIISTVFCGATNISFSFIAGAFSLTLIAASGYILNDIFDVEIDKINRPNRPIPAGKISLKAAKFYYLLLLIFSYVFAYFSSTTVIIFNSVIILLLILYSYKLKAIVLVGNFLVAAITASAFIMGGILTNNIIAALIPSVFAFQVNSIREIIKDAQDIEGDKANNTITFAGKYGMSKCVYLVNFLIVLLIVTTTIPFIFKLYKIEYFVIVMLSANVIYIYILFLLQRNNLKDKISRISGLLKFSMIFGLIAIYFGV